ncbi:hypothetical protein ABFS83_10G120400 [Erythranthe nasuta]
MKFNFKIPKPFICKSKVCIPTSFLLVKNITNQVILGTLFFVFKKIFPIKRIDYQGFLGTFDGKQINFHFITEPFTRIFHQIKDSFIKNKQNQIIFLKQEISILNIDGTLQNLKLQDKIKLLNNKFSLQICNDHPNAFSDRKKHIVLLPNEDNFDERKIPTKARPCQMNKDYLELCKKEIENLQKKGLIRPSKSPRSCTAFYVN